MRVRKDGNPIRGVWGTVLHPMWKEPGQGDSIISYYAGKGTEFVLLATALTFGCFTPSAAWLLTPTPALPPPTLAIQVPASSNKILCPIYSGPSQWFLKVLHWGRSQPPTASKASRERETVCVCVLHFFHLVTYTSHIPSKKKKKNRTDRHFVQKQAWRVMLKTPVGNRLVCNAFWPSRLFISASVTLTLSLSRPAAFLRVPFWQTQRQLSPFLSHTYLDFLGVRKLSWAIYSERQRKSLCFKDWAAISCSQTCTGGRTHCSLGSRNSFRLHIKQWETGSRSEGAQPSIFHCNIYTLQ